MALSHCAAEETEAHRHLMPSGSRQEEAAGLEPWPACEAGSLGGARRPSEAQRWASRSSWATSCRRLEKSDLGDTCPLTEAAIPGLRGRTVPTWGGCLRSWALRDPGPGTQH